MEKTGMSMTKEYKQIQRVIRVYGIVQGVGFRPFVSRIADSNRIFGSVANKGSYVEIFTQGTSADTDHFISDLKNRPPERAAVLKTDISDWEGPSFDSFEIIESEKEAGDIFVSPDIATCSRCKRELFDPSNRRYMHPFINCTACGPRLTILDSMPYDRVRTSMGEFPMCPECEYEYTHSETRRYDAQPVCCNDCGPEVYILGRDLKGKDAITTVRKAIRDGQIVALKGIGGFHLCCNAKDQEAVSRLRLLKRRPAKPFAVMMKDLDTVSRECFADDTQLEMLDGHQKPIILLKRRDSSHMAPAVAPDNPKTGVMLPYAPIHMLLFEYNDEIDIGTDCLVMTSGNVSGAPICRTDEDAQTELSGFCDLILSHNRKIRLRADDSVTDFYKGKPYMIRRSRGFAPLPVMLSGNRQGTVLGIGGELKNTFCIAKNSLYYPSPYVGDMEDLRTVRALEESITRMEELLESEPSIAVCDLHPRYNTTIVAEEQGLPVLRVQHHFAHVLSCLAENDVDQNERILGVSFDGTGFGTDETIWGGEILDCKGSSFKRAGHIMPFKHIGGDIASKEGFRIAVSMINSLYDEEEARRIAEKLELCEPALQKVLMNMGSRNINTIKSTSAGRLFDAVSAILNIKLTSTFEGEASMTLEFRAEEFEETVLGSGGDPESFVDDIIEQNSELLEPASVYEPDEDQSENAKTLIMRTDILVKYIILERLKGTEPEKLAYIFHSVLARQIIDICFRLSSDNQVNGCALTGGVFQNQLLLKLTDDGLERRGLKVYRHSLIPPNDGGIALGQALAGMYEINRK